MTIPLEKNQLLGTGPFYWLCISITFAKLNADSFIASGTKHVRIRVSHENMFFKKKMAQPAPQVFGGCFEGIQKDF